MRGAVFGLPAGAKIKSIQYVSTAGASAAGQVGQSKTVAISAVDMAKAIVVPIMQYANVGTAVNLISLQLTASNQVTVYGGSAENDAIRFAVIEFEGNVKIQRGSTTLSASANVSNVTVNSYSNAKAFIVTTSYVLTSTSNSWMSNCVYGTCPSATTIAVNRYATSARFAITAHWQLITFE